MLKSNWQTNSVEILQWGHYLHILRRKINYWVYTAWMRYYRIWMNTGKDAWGSNRDLCRYISQHSSGSTGESRYTYNPLWTGRPWVPNECIHNPNVIPLLCGSNKKEIANNNEVNSNNNILLLLILLQYNEDGEPARFYTCIQEAGSSILYRDTG